MLQPAPRSGGLRRGRRLTFAALAVLTVLSLLGCDVQDEPEPDADETGAGGDGGGRADARPPTEDLGPEPCTANDDCEDPLPFCRRVAGEPGRCVECLDSTFCPRNLPVCGLDDTCVPRDPSQCREDLDCAASRPRCVLPGVDAVGLCVQCASNADCAGGTPTCATTGTCVGRGASSACTADAQCGARRFCVSGDCAF
jgi:hypothetical protein